ncbi:hypothetical protein, partial [Vibrio parahaemolyticus]|uniref:hypothetical protein n=1 Tax=Vibrio parahaemolyticus TaxID=670 RepID=UPI0035C0C8F8
YDAATGSNIELVTLEELKKTVAYSILPLITPTRAMAASPSPANRTEPTKEFLDILRKPTASCQPEVYREYLLINHGCQRTQKAACTGLSKLPSKASVVA